MYPKGTCSASHPAAAKFSVTALFNGGGIWYNGAKQRAAGIFFAAPAQKEELPMNMEQYSQELMDTAKGLFAVDSPAASPPV